MQAYLTAQTPHTPKRSSLATLSDCAESDVVDWSERRYIGLMMGSDSATSNNRRKATKRKNALSTDATRYRLRVLCVCASISCMISTKRPRKGEGGVSGEFACVIKAARD